ncbi:hypothetical protein WICPIJ_006563 [Wickerhamomyces pijperi]|uniref:Small ribosomal subunit protein uS11m n=1 Tax=Wickerhamomyces pijperi TaxID=599730 RepID=A0A9P8Q3G7_WICPI|nr:hypothetical protein WICPIJ_006563 [Wickerhamomyces pijperi]
MLSRLLTPLRASSSIQRISPLTRTFATSPISRQVSEEANSKLLFALLTENSASTTSPNGETKNTRAASFEDSNSISKATLPETIHRYILHCNFTKNNTHLTLTAVTEDNQFLSKNPNLSTNEKILYYYQLPEVVKISISTGALGFKKSARGEYEATFQTAAKMFQLMEEKGFLDKELYLVFKNFGKGRDSFIDAIMGKEGNKIRPKVTNLFDDTKLKFGGTRSKKSRRL